MIFSIIDKKWKDHAEELFLEHRTPFFYIFNVENFQHRESSLYWHLMWFVKKEDYKKITDTTTKTLPFLITGKCNVKKIFIKITYHS